MRRIMCAAPAISKRALEKSAAVIASEAKQSRATSAGWITSSQVLLAMTT
jgi:hypothetical protein